tara:strand:+ start:354 stop:521 length:168 start_codon:yes stop_codon:yes gene_type:complete
MINSCSSEKKTFLLKENVNKTKISKLKFDYNLTFEEFKKNAVEYGKLSDYPKLDD